MKLRGRVAVITGAGGYLGRGMALRLSEERSRVFLGQCMGGDKNAEARTCGVNILSI